MSCLVRVFDYSKDQTPGAAYARTQLCPTEQLALTAAFRTSNKLIVDEAPLPQLDSPWRSDSCTPRTELQAHPVGGGAESQYAVASTGGWR